MKKLIIITLLLSSINTYSQGYMEKIMAKMETTPPCWEKGMGIEQIHVNKTTGQIIYKINNGSYYKLHREFIKKEFISLEIKLKDILYSETYLFIWADKGIIKYSLNGISGNKRDVLPLYKLNIIILNEEILCIQTFDMRGMKLERVTGGV